MVPLFLAFRPRQWTKNLFVLAPVVFAREATDRSLLCRAVVAFIVFCAAASAIYLANDVVDLASDREHPTKKFRPIASGRLSVKNAKMGALVLLTASLAAAYYLSLSFALVVAGYVALNIFYSLAIKKIAYLDVLSIAGGFLLRVLGGATATLVVLSPYLLACTTLVALFLGFGKRAHELITQGSDSEKGRKALRHYRLATLKRILLATGIATFVAYVFYALSPKTADFFHTHKIIWTVPFVGFGLIRFAQLALRSDRAESPTDAMLSDIPFLLNIGLWGVTLLFIIY